MRVSCVSCICNSFEIHRMYHCLYGKTQRCSCCGFRFVKQIILRNRSYVNIALKSRGRKRSDDINTAFVQYLFMHFLVEAIRSKLKHFHSYMISRQGLFICITWSCEDFRRTRNNSIPLWYILTVITNCTTCNIQRCETWPRASNSDTWLKTQF